MLACEYSNHSNVCSAPAVVVTARSGHLRQPWCALLQIRSQLVQPVIVTQPKSNRSESNMDHMTPTWICTARALSSTAFALLVVSANWSCKDSMLQSTHTTSAASLITDIHTTCNERSRLRVLVVEHLHLQPLCLGSQQRFRCDQLFLPPRPHRFRAR